MMYGSVEGADEVGVGGRSPLSSTCPPARSSLDLLVVFVHTSDKHDYYSSFPLHWKGKKVD